MDAAAITPLVLAGLAGAGIAALVMTVNNLRRELADFRRQRDIATVTAASPHTHNGAGLSGEIVQQISHRAQMLSMAALVKLAARDNLDALIRMSPDMADEVLREMVPHLFNKETD